jgi:hypothetical protein
MDPMITPIVVILGKYALNKGAELAKEVGPKALETAKTMFQTVLERVGQKKPETAAEFPNDPEAYQKPLEKALEAEVQTDPDLAAQLKALLQEYEEAAQAHAAAMGQTYQATVKGSGAVAQDHSVAAGEGGFAIKGDVHGGITVGHRKEPKE